METIRILLYTDYSKISQGQNFWGLTDLERFIKLKIKGIANVEFGLLNRHFDYKNNKPVDGATRLTSKLLSNYDELWVFGVLPMNTEGHPHNELDKREVKVLRKWMKTGGVMITGDHSNPIEDLTCESDHKDFVNLGAALGRNIPRAGQLRVWDGPPTGCYDGPLEDRDNYNTHEGDNPAKLDNPIRQSDVLPLTLRLTPDNPPHRLFWWRVDPNSKEVVPIRKFPDHIHEGKLKRLQELDGDWPAHSSPPMVVAQARDNRFPDELRYYDLVMAYDGDLGGVGRIVADSSFHHYIDRNLLRIPARDNRVPRPGTALDQIAQYYCNLALWLAPKKVRNRISWGLFFWAASHPDVLEDKGNKPHIIGRTVLSALELEIGTSNLYRLLAPSEYESDSELINDFLSSIFLGDKSPSKWSFIKPDIALGHIVQEYHKLFQKRNIIDPGWCERDPAPPEIIIEGLARALESEAGDKEAFLSQFREHAEAFRRECNDKDREVTESEDKAETDDD